MKEVFREIYNDHIKRPGADKLLEWLEKTDFFVAPASTRFHLSCEGGLVKHSVHVYERLRELYCNELARNSSGPVILTDEEEETIAVCGLLHDVCKANVYKKEPKNQKSYDPEKVKRAQKWQIKHDELGDFIWESVMSYKFEDQMPYGHGDKSVYIVSGFMKLSREEAFAIRFHMGTWQDGEKQNVGNAFNMFPLAVMMHLADMQATYFDEKDEK